MITFFSNINQKLDIYLPNESDESHEIQSTRNCMFAMIFFTITRLTQRQSPSSTRLASHALCSLATYFLSFASIWVLLEAKDPMNEFPHQSELEHHDFFHFYIFETISGGL